MTYSEPLASTLQNPSRLPFQSPFQSPPAVQGPPPAPHSSPEPPFEIRVEHRDADRRGTFRPQAHVGFSAPLRLGGLLAALSPEAVKDLLLVLSFVTANGHCAPALHQLAEAMCVSPGKARSRLAKLEEVRFQGQRLLSHQRTESGLELFSPLLWLAPVREDAKPPLPYPSPPPIRAASREAVIEHTRQTYARPQAEVERQIEEMMGYNRDGKRLPQVPQTVAQAVEEPPLTEEEREARREREEVREQLLAVGLVPEQAQALLEGYDLLGIRRQLAWLPYRRAKNPAGMLLAAVKDDYEAPQMVRRQHVEVEADVAPEPALALEAQTVEVEQAFTETSGEMPEVTLRVPEHGEEG